ncbi:hypothetical protein JR316_0007919 [Psilocybe cubensis]|uniref:Rhodopsin domain-containing protein n=2 Tax=Psilocybe cubensis TaxID=181762 RepID=A0A8H7XT45_PSICU|nr:hypothetical protein JR316_0007919 [Psilocybe cubensis]KAH9479329.1 hypothetical protein JR316_0007919 [Psilocybe cubensis]
MTLDLSFGVTLSLDVVLTVVHVIAITLTAFRVYYRAVTQRYWWDDFVATMALVGDCVYLSALWFEYAKPNSVLQEHKVLVARYWLGLMLFLLVEWMTRISLALAIARIFPPQQPTRRFAVGLALLSTAFCLAILTEAAVICAHQPALVSGPEAACQWPDSLRTLIVVANISSDSLLIATPLYKLWRVRLPRKQRRLILCGFTASALTTSATVACAVFLFAPESLEPGKTILRGKLSYFETGISLIACNLLVVMAYFYSVFHRGEDTELLEYTSETCETRSVGTISHSNHMPSSVATPYTLTEITDQSTLEDIGCTGGSVLTSGRSTSEHRTDFSRSTH